MTTDWLRHATHLATCTRTCYDASWAATAEKLGMALASADRQLLRAGLAESPTATVARLRLPLESWVGATVTKGTSRGLSSPLRG